MNDKQIQALLAISEVGSMNRAAEKLYISQPALKKRMDTLEEEMGVPLLARDSGGCTLTEAGRFFVEEIRPLFEQMEAVVEKTRRVQKRRTLRLCAMPDIAMREQDEQLIAFARENPDVTVERVLLPTSGWFDAVCEGRADLCCGFCIPEKMEDYARRGLAFCEMSGRGRAVCVVSSRHPLAQKKRIEAKDLVGYRVYAGPLICEGGGLGKFAQSAGFSLQCDEAAGKRYEMLSRCEEGAVFIHSRGYSEDLKPLRVIPLAGFSICAGWAYADRGNEAVLRFLRFLGLTPI